MQQSRQSELIKLTIFSLKKIPKCTIIIFKKIMLRVYAPLSIELENKSKIQEDIQKNEKHEAKRGHV